MQYFQFSIKCNKDETHMVLINLTKNKMLVFNQNGTKICSRSFENICQGKSFKLKNTNGFTQPKAFTVSPNGLNYVFKSSNED